VKVVTRAVQRTGFLLAVATSLLFAWLWRGTLTIVAYSNDSSTHEEMVRVASQLLHAGRDPLATWYPYLSGGTAQFLHYQPLPALLTGAAGLVVGPNTAFVWSTYLLLILWPLGLYGFGRLMGLSDMQSGLLALMGSCVVSVSRIGYEPKSYVWVGYGLWAQQWGMWFFAFTVGALYRAWSNWRWMLLAIVGFSLTFACHFETAYLAVVAVIAMFLVHWREVRRAMRFAGTILLGTMVGTAWLWIPLVAQSAYAAQNEVLRSTPLGKGYGARKLLTWFFTGSFMDFGHFPILTALTILGFVLIMLRRVSTPSLRYLLLLALGSFILGSGRTSFGGLLRVVPAVDDLYLRRFTMGAGLVLLVVASLGLDYVLRLFLDKAANLTKAVAPLLTSQLCALLAIFVLLPAMPTIWYLSTWNQQAVQEQYQQGAADARSFQPVANYLDHHPGGRVFAGSFQDWGPSLLVGKVPVYQYLAFLDRQEIGYQLRNAALMGPAEWHLSPDSLSNLRAFGVRYVLTPVNSPSTSVGTVVLRSGPYVVRSVPGASLFALGEVTSSIAANRRNIGLRTLPYLRSPDFGLGEFQAIRFNGSAPVPLRRAGEVGRVVQTHEALTTGEASATVSLVRTATLYFSVSFDPGWHVYVDGHERPSYPLAPGAIGVTVGQGHHQVTFLYRGYAHYPLLLLFSGSSLAVMCYFALRGRCRGKVFTRSRSPKEVHAVY
jgi:hypothetical protein